MLPCGRARMIATLTLATNSDDSDLYYTKMLCLSLMSKLQKTANGNIIGIFAVCSIFCHACLCDEMKRSRTYYSVLLKMN